MGFFDTVESLPPDPILSITATFAADLRKKKVNLGVGSYKTQTLHPYVFPSVQEAERRLCENGFNKEYLPIEGLGDYLDAIRPLICGITGVSDRISLFQTLGGTGALAVGARFLKAQGSNGHIFLPDPTWDNHARLFSHAGFSIESYPYCSARHPTFDIEAMLKSLRSMSANSVVLLQACAHNPSGVDPTLEQWYKIAEVIKKHKLIPFFDLAYQGLAVDLEEDVAAIRYFLSQQIECLVAVSFSKNFGLYAERIGALIIAASDRKVACNIESQIKVIIRSLYSNPPCHGARIVATILRDAHLRKQWEKELLQMRERIQSMRELLANRLQAANLEHFAFIKAQKGMFSLTWLPNDVVQRLIDEFGIYLSKNGRINLSGLNSENVDYVVELIGMTLSKQ